MRGSPTSESKTMIMESVNCFVEMIDVIHGQFAKLTSAVKGYLLSSIHPHPSHTMNHHHEPQPSTTCLRGLLATLALSCYFTPPTNSRTNASKDCHSLLIISPDQFSQLIHPRMSVCCASTFAKLGTALVVVLAGQTEKIQLGLLIQVIFGFCLHIIIGLIRTSEGFIGLLITT